MKFKLTKTIQYVNSRVEEGTSIEGNLLQIKKSSTIYGAVPYMILDEDTNSIFDILDIGDRLILVGDESYISPSEVISVEGNTDTKLTFNTKTSTYELELIND